jgi:hypothetical protein
MDHWFRPEVKLQLLRLLNHIHTVEHQPSREFFLATFSAFLRGVSNADPQHVFPGYSKRMRKLDEEGRKIDVRASFIRAARKRMDQVCALRPDGAPVTVLTGDAREFRGMDGQFAAAVINPPYISSIRYLETMKLEMGWLGWVHSQTEYLDLDKHVIGTERYYKKDLAHIPVVGVPEVDQHVKNLASSHPKMAKVVAEYFIGMRECLKRIQAALRVGGTLTIKISDSKVRSELIETHKHFTTMAREIGFRLIAEFIDEFDPNSRSLLTARNSYSGIMTHDRILVLERM